MLQLKDDRDHGQARLLRKDPHHLKGLISQHSSRDRVQKHRLRAIHFLLAAAAVTAVKAAVAGLRLAHAPGHPQKAAMAHTILRVLGFARLRLLVKTLKARRRG